MRRSTIATAAALTLALALGGSAMAQRIPGGDGEGVKIRSASLLRKLYPVGQMEATSAAQYSQLKRQTTAKGALLPATDATATRLRRIAEDMLPFAEKWNPRAKDWKWEVVAIKAPTINAFCMPGGKIAFFTGIIEKLNLSDDEIAMVMGHEIAHALREHARARAAKGMLTNLGAVAVSVLIGGQAGQIAQQGAGLLGLKFSRDDEKEADLVGMELAARAGYDPRTGIGLWEKMSALAKGAPPQWMSTHPSGETRIELIKTHLPEVMPLYERAVAAKKPR